MDLATQTLKPYGLDALIGKPVLAAETQKSLDAALDKADNVALITSLYGSLTKIGPLLGMKQNPKPEPLVKLGTVTDYKINGDKATAQNGAETMKFVRIGGRWYIEPPPSKGPGGSARRRRRQGPRARASQRRAARRPRPARNPRSSSAASRSRGSSCRITSSRPSRSTPTTARRSCCG